MNDPYCPKWDKTINELLDNNQFTFITWKSIPSVQVRGIYKLGDYHIWCCNYPYAFGSNTDIFLHNRFGVKNHRPSRLTILRIKERLLEDLDVYV